METHEPVLSVLSALLDYPDQPLLDAIPEIRGILNGHKLPRATRAGLDGLIAYLEATPLIELQEAYVEAFDRGRATSLYLFEHVHGESRERGQAMIDLLAMYEAGGLYLSAGELPDYLPVFLEFLAHEPRERARSLLGEVADINRAIAVQLARRGVPYFAAVAALLPLAGEPPLALDGQAVEENPPIDTEALDKEWQDEPVSFLNAQSPVSAQPIQFYDKRPPG
jgi:nitrate reductase delta subunit